MQERNDELWRPPSSASIASPIRTRQFWLSVLLGPEANADDQDPLWYRASTQVALGPFTVDVGPFSTRLYWSADWQFEQRLLAWVDEAHPTPVTFRWSEAQAIARHLEAEAYRPHPTQPSLVLLLLSPFVGVTSFDDVGAIQHQFEEEVRQLGLLKNDEIAEAVQGLLRPAKPTTAQGDFVPFEWKPDAQVGWERHGGIRLQAGDQEIFLGNHSLRTSSNPDFPATEFVNYLREIGIDDL